MNKIAITGLSGLNRTLMAQVLSNVTQIQFLRNKTMYEWCRLCNVFEPENLTLKDRVLIASLSYFERVKTESYFDEFISDGALFSEPVELKSPLVQQPNNKRVKELYKAVESIERVSVLQAIQQYDHIVHICFGVDDCINDPYPELYMRYNMLHKMYSMGSIEQTVSEIVRDIGFPVKQAIEDAVYQGKKIFFFLSDDKMKIQPVVSAKTALDKTQEDILE